MDKIFGENKAVGEGLHKSLSDAPRESGFT